MSMMLHRAGIMSAQLFPALSDRAFDLTASPVDGVFEDRSGLGNDLVSASGWGVELDGVGDYILFPHTNKLDLAGKRLRISFTLRISAYPGSPENILSTAKFFDSGYRLVIRTDGLINCQVMRDGGLYASGRTTSPLALNAFHEISFELDNARVVNAFVNGVSDYLETTAPTGAYVEQNRRLCLMASESTNDNFVDNAAGDLCNVLIRDLDTDEILFQPPLSDHPPGSLDGLPAFDASGNENHGEYVGCEAINGEEWPVPQMALRDWNRRMWFDGVDDYVDFGDSSDFDVALGTKRVFEAKFLVEETGSKVHSLFRTHDTTEYDGLIILVANSGRIWVSYGAGGGTAFNYIRTATTTNNPILPNQVYDLKVEATNLNDIKVYLNGQLQSVDYSGTATTVSNPVSATAKIGESSNSSAWRLEGSIWDIYWKDESEDVISHWLNIGNTNADWEDQVGTNNSTVNGSPANTYFPESLVNPGQDVLGNQIDNPRGKLLNPTGETGDGAQIADDSTLAAMKSWVFIIDYDGEDHTLIDLGTPTISAASDALTSSGITSPTYYVDGVAGTALSQGKRLIVVTTATATDCGPVDVATSLQTRPVLGYDVELSAAQVASIFRNPKIKALLS